MGVPVSRPLSAARGRSERARLEEGFRKGTLRPVGTAGPGALLESAVSLLIWEGKFLNEKSRTLTKASVRLPN